MASSSKSERCKHLIVKANDLTKKGQYEESLSLYREALAVSHSDKLVKRIKKIEV